jgi:hypothetical protein
MKLKTAITISLKILFAVCILLIIGALSTQIFISDNMENFKGYKHKFAGDAMTAARIGCLDHPIEAFLNQKIRLEMLETAVTCPEETGLLQQNYHAVLQTFSFFGIPMKKITVTCGSVICNY